MRGRGAPDPLPDPWVADGASDGSLDGGLHLGPGDLAPDEERLLAALERDSAALHVDPVDEFVASVRAGRSHTLPEAVATAADDGLTPLFTAPDET
jgi:hypothetical protein